MKKFYLIAFTFLLFIVAGAQVRKTFDQTKDYPWQLGIGVGYTNYYGDLSNYQINRLGDIDKIYHFADFNKHYIPQPSFSLLLEKRINPTIGFMLQFNQLSFAMSDRYRYKGGTLDQSATNFSRALNFKTSLRDAGFALSFNGNNGHAFKENSFFYPSFYLGGGVAVFNVYGDLYDATGNPYNYNNQPAFINDGDYETNLRDLKTETANRYSNITPYLDFGLSLNFRLNSLLVLSLQSDIKYASDYLDDVSGQYKIAYPSAAAAYAAHPGYNIIDPVTRQRGDVKDMNDFYINNRVVLHINLSHPKHAPVFKAPAIYSLSYSPAIKLMNDSTALQQQRQITDSLRRLIRDTLMTKLDTSHKQADTAYQQRLEYRLDSIQSELKGIKTVIRNQAFEAKIQYLRFKQDSVKQLKKNIQAQKIISREDNLKIRIYDLQNDSLRNEMMLMQRRAEAGMDNADSSWVLSPVSQYNFTQATVAGRMPTDSTIKPDTVRVISDSITDQQIDKLSQAFDQMKNDSRYSKDSLYRLTVDSLTNKLSAYEHEKLRLAVEQRRADSLTALQLRAVTKAVSDSSSSRVNAQDTVGNVPRVLPADSSRRDTALDNALQVLQRSVTKSNDSLATLRRALQQNRDSAAYYKRLAFAANPSGDTIVTKPAKWYQRIIPGQRKRNNNEQQELQKINDQEKYYDDQITKLNDRINDVAQRNNDINTNYDRTRRRRDERVYPTAAPTVIRETSNSRNNNDLSQLRNEINALRNQLLVQQAVETGVNSRQQTDLRKMVSDTVYIRVPKSDSLVQQTNVVNPQMIAMQQEIARLKTDLEGMKAAAAKPVVPSAAPIIKKQPIEDATVYFGLGSATLSSDQVNKLNGLAKKAAADSGAVLTLTGYTDAVGNAAVNNALAKKRMIYVQTLLVTRFDIAAGNIHMEEPVISVTKGSRQNALNRKVIITVQ